MLTFWGQSDFIHPLKPHHKEYLLTPVRRTFMRKMGARLGGSHSDPNSIEAGIRSSKSAWRARRVIGQPGLPSKPWSEKRRGMN